MRFHYLVRGVCLINHRLLVVREIGANNTFLPGGHVEIGEKAEDALVREIQEELGMDVRVGRHLGAIEHKWPEKLPDNHEINLFFEIEIPNIVVSVNPVSMEQHLEFFWAEIGSLRSVNLQPAPLQNYIAVPIEEICSFWASTITS